MPLTVRTSLECQNAKVAPAKRLEYKADTGLYLRVEPSGKKSWLLRHEVGGKKAAMVMGPFQAAGTPQPPAIRQPLSLADARFLASRLRDQARAGADDGRWVTALTQYVQEHACRLSSARERLSVLGFDPDTKEPRPGGLAMRWADRPARSITATDVVRAASDAVKRGVPGEKGRKTGASPSRERRLFVALREALGWMHSKQIILQNPMAGLAEPAKPNSRERVLTDAELAKVWEACAGLGVFGRAIRFLAVTGQRRDEVGEMRNAELVDKVWTLPPKRVKNRRTHAITLPQMALDQIGTAPPGEFVFSTTGGRRPISGWSKAKEALDGALGDDFEPFTIHDLRRTAASGMASMRVPIHVIERVLNHTSGAVSGVAAVYNRYSYRDEVAEALVAWAGYIERQVLGGGSDNIVQITASSG